MGRPGGRVMAATYEITSVPWVDPPDVQRRRWQRVCAWRDLGWEWPAPSLASLHANPAHSALRRVCLFDSAAEKALEHGDGGALHDYWAAARAALWSVR